MIKLSLKLGISSSKLFLGFVGISATIGALCYFSHQNKTINYLKSDDKISTSGSIKTGVLNCDKVGSNNHSMEIISNSSKSHVENDHLKTNFACEGIHTLDHNSQSIITKATFTQNNNKMVTLDGFNVDFKVENNKKTNKDKTEDELSYVNENQDQLRTEELIVTNNSPHNSREDKKFVGTKEEPELAEELTEKDTREANKLKVDTIESSSADKENLVLNENSNDIENKQANINFDYGFHNLKILSQYISVDVQQFKILRSLLNDHKGNRAIRLKDIKIKCQTFGEIYDEVKGSLSHDVVRYLVNQIFILRTDLWKEVHSEERSSNSLTVKKDFKVTGNTKKLVDGIIEFLEQLDATVDYLGQSFYLLQNVLHSSQDSKVKDQNDLNSTFSKYMDSKDLLIEILENSKCFSMIEDVQEDVAEIINLTCYFCTDYEKLFVGYV